MTSTNGAPPDDFNAYWDHVIAELAAIPPAPEVEEIPLRSTDFATAYGVRLTSIGPYRIYAYLSIPHGDGPFPAVSELVAGFWIWEVSSMDEAIEWVRRCPNPMPGPSEIEIRPLYEMEDFAEAMTPELVEQEERLRESTGS